MAFFGRRFGIHDQVDITRKLLFFFPYVDLTTKKAVTPVHPTANNGAAVNNSMPLCEYHIQTTTEEYIFDDDVERRRVCRWLASHIL